MRKKAERYSRRTNAQAETVLTYRLPENRTVNGPLRLLLRMIFTIMIRHFTYPCWGDRKKEFALSFFPEGGVCWMEAANG